MRYRPFRVVFASVLAVASYATLAAAEETGRQLYVRYCGACHGPDAHGDGIAAGMLRTKPPDLTRLASRRGGDFPIDLVVKTIDGREMPRAHGAPTMPVWGEILAREVGGDGSRAVGVERRVQERIYAIAEYLRSIQAE
jgi:mono/diheme cytochrome c family protein